TTTFLPLAMFIYSFFLCYSLSLYPFTERYAQPYFFSCLIRQTSNALHNAIMEAGGKDRPPMLAPAGGKDHPPMLAPDKDVPVVEGSSETTTERYMKNYKNVSQDIRDQKAIERLKQGESINVQDLETNLY
nr:hypothetical protein [Tanacetum cinerariifolium]